MTARWGAASALSELRHRCQTIWGYFIIVPVPIAMSCTILSSGPVTCTPTTKPPKGITDARLSSTVMFASWSDSIIWAASNELSKSSEYDTTATVFPAYAPSSLAMPSRFSALIRRGATCCSNLIRNRRSAPVRCCASLAFLSASAMAARAIAASFSRAAVCFRASAISALALAASTSNAAALSCAVPAASFARAASTCALSVSIRACSRKASQCRSLIIPSQTITAVALKPTTVAG
jgi:hypothetical protein